MTADAQIMEGALGPLLIALAATGVSRIAFAAVTRGAFHQYWHAARLGALVVTPDTLGAFLSLMSKLTVGIEISFVVTVPEQHRPACSFCVQLDNARLKVI